MSTSEDTLDAGEATLAGPPLSGTASSSTPADGDPRPRNPAELLLRGELGLTRLGHYVLLHKLGEGGMGVVFAAYDEKLDRKVAIKLLRGRDDAGLRLVREAQAMARLSHPNVVQIYEIGELPGEQRLTFIVMEFVDGLTLAAWRSQQARTRGELLAVFVAAGRGLAAAHRKGLVHRDFKPDNVMITREGRVVVMDFGLAREGGSVGERSVEVALPTAALTDSHDSVLSSDLTATGALMGTPAYMAPEQFRGDPTDAQTDQFAFCVALWEALFGIRPFAAPNVAALSLAVLRGEIQRPERHEVPSWLERVLERGLALEPTARWPDMGALLDALTRDPTTRRRGWIAGLTAVAVLVAVLAGVRAAQARADTQARTGCAAEAQAINEVWSDEVAASLDQRFADASALSSWQRARVWMDDYAKRWAALHERSCVSARVERSRTPSHHERVTVCLDEARTRVAALVDIWTSAELGVVAYTATAAASLPPVAQCDDQAWLAQRVAPPSGSEAEVAEARAELERAEALRLLAEFEAGRTRAAKVLAWAEQLGWTPLIAEARLSVGRLERELGELPQARASLERTVLEATRGAHDLVALRAAVELASVAGYELSERDAGRYWIAMAKALLERVGLRGTVDEAALLGAEADIHWSVGEYDEALRALEAARDITSRELGPEHPDVASDLAEIGNVYKEQGRYDDAVEQFERARALAVAALGPTHPQLGELDSYLGDTQHLRGNAAEALAAQQRALALFEAALGPEHPRLVDAFNSLGSALYDNGLDDESLAAYERALELAETRLGPEHPSVGTALNNIATAQTERQDYVAAEATHRRALELWTRAYGAEHQYIGISHANIATVLLLQGKTADAIAEFELSLAIFEAALGPDHLYVGMVSSSLGRAYASIQDYARARELLERALTITLASDGNRGVGRARMRLAEVLGELGELERATELMQLAREDLVSEGNTEEERALIDAWLAEHDPRP